MMDKQETDGGKEASSETRNVVIDTEPISTEGMKRSNRFPLPLTVDELRCWQYFDEYMSCHS
jgi:hypothetical protein